MSSSFGTVSLEAFSRTDPTDDTSGMETNHLNCPKRIPNCQKCGQHGKINRLKGHKTQCPFRDCICEKCDVVTRRQKVMAHQIKMRRRKHKNTTINMTRDLTNEWLYNQANTVPLSVSTPTALSNGSYYSPTSSLTPSLSDLLPAATMPSSPGLQPIAAPVPIYPTSASTAFPSQMITNQGLLQGLIANYLNSQQNGYAQPSQPINTVVHVSV